MAVIQCPKCGKNVSNLAVKCPHCGGQIDRAGGTPEYIVPRPEGGSVAKKIVTLVVIVALLGAAAYFVLTMFGINIIP